MLLNIQTYQDKALRHLALCKERYKTDSADSVPLIIAQEWANAFAKDNIDIDEIAHIVRVAEQSKDSYDMLFFMFCNDIRKIYREMWENHLNIG